MQYLGLGLGVVGFIGVMWLLARSMTGTERNEGSKHGGGMDNIGTDPGPYAQGDSSDV
jgi:hypothetical protein